MIMDGKKQMTIAACIDEVAAQLAGAGLYFGHGTDNARDEAAWLVLHVLGESLDGSFSDWGRPVDEDARAGIRRLVGARCKSGEPLAYLTGFTYFAGLKFEVSRGVLVPRSPISELILDRFQPWLRPEKVERVLDMCTGSGCIAIATALNLPDARIDAVDISAEALEIARRNARHHGVSQRVHLFESDLFQSLPACRYDLIVANPPYVPAGDLKELPKEYRCEPGIGLVSGEDGLDAVLTIMVDAPGYLREDGILVCEVGESERRLAAVLPRVPFLWLEFERGGSGVFVLTRDQLEEARPDVVTLIGEREYVA